jgi:outer membrane protein assembly factor BamB
MGPLRPGDPERVGNYRLLARIGSGGMGVVYLARSPGGRAVAVKVVRALFAADPQFRARFRREVAAARLVSNACTAAVLDADPDAVRPWLATVYLPGLTLREAAVGGLPPQTLRVLAASVVEALVDIHRVGLVHRDLKPANIMVTHDGVRVIDFGIARPDDATAITGLGTVVGTPGFMSPEQVSGATVGPASDIFSLGSVLMFAATGRDPFHSDAVDVTLRRVQQVDTDLDAVTEPWLRDLVGRCLRADPRDRPTAAQLLTRFRGGEAAVDAGWLPPVLADEIDRRAAQPLEPGDAVPGPAHPLETGVAAPAPAYLTGATIEPPLVGRAATSPTRRRVLIGGAAALTCVTVAVAWKRGRDRPDAARPPTTPAPSPSTTAAPPAERWRFKVSDYYPEALYTVPGIVVARASEEELFALDAGTGRLLWKHRASLTGTVAGGMVFEAQNTNPELALVDPASGTFRWTSVVPVRESPSRVAVSGQLVCYGYEGVRALGTGDGRTRWTADVDTKIDLAAVADVVVAAGEKAVVGVDAATGRVRWRVPMDRPLWLTPGTDLMFVTDIRNGLHALRPADGTVAWQKTDVIGISPPRFHGATLYVNGRGGVTALNPATGDQLWWRDLGHDSDLEVSGDTICAATLDNTLHGLHTADGRPLWTLTANATRLPTLTGGVMTSLPGQFFIGVEEGYVIAIGGHGAGPGMR